MSAPREVFLCQECIEDATMCRRSRLEHGKNTTGSTKFIRADLVERLIEAGDNARDYIQGAPGTVQERTKLIEAWDAALAALREGK